MTKTFLRLAERKGSYPWLTESEREEMLTVIRAATYGYTQGIDQLLLDRVQGFCER